MKLLSNAALALCALLPSCAIEQSCTVIGCLSGVRITWSNFAPQQRVVIVADGARYAFDCATAPALPLSCEPDGVRLEARPRALSVEVTTASGVRRGTFAPTYVTTQPNGPDCGPTCYSASVVVM